MAKSRKGPILLILFLIGMIGLIVYAADWILVTSHGQMRRDTEQSLRNGAAQQVALLTVWYGSLSSQIKAFVTVDRLRLFASEIDSRKINPKELVDPASGNDPKLAGFVERLPGLSYLLSEFVSNNEFFSGTVLTPDGLPFLSTKTDMSVSKAGKACVSEVVAKKAPVFLPLTKINQELALTLAVPIFAPSYIDQKGERVVAVFLGTVSVHKAVVAIAQTDPEGFFTSAVLERSQEKLSLIDPLFPGVHRELGPDWALEEGTLPMSIRNEPTRLEKDIPSYALALPVPDVPWLVMQGMRVTQAEAAYHRLQKNVYIGAGLSGALVIIFIAALWWWIVGRRERAMADQMRRLYEVAREQKQILDSVNTAVPAGIVVNDLSGMIYYANHRFADMVKMPSDRVIGSMYTQLPIAFARSLVTHTIQMSEKPELANFTETLPSERDEGVFRSYLTACSPCADENSCLSGMVSVYSDITDLVAAQEKAQRMVNKTVDVFVRAIEAIDPYLQGQSSRTAFLAERLAIALGLTDTETRDTLLIAAELSQIGMIQLPRELLLKSGALSKEERKQLEQHVEYARASLEGVDFGLPVLEAITEMYERFDGSGYPKHLVGEAICQNARILAVANTFCALLRPRSYRTAHTMESALAILEKKPPTYDPRVVDALKDFLASDEGKSFFQTLTINCAHEE
ncbi:MAG: HD domain-containing protein [Desulfovibrionaceae bacterium]|nr:HD domain-containing protein [Desulfovibrionaceae bacterium]